MKKEDERKAARKKAREIFDQVTLRADSSLPSPHTSHFTLLRVAWGHPTVGAASPSSPLRTSSSPHPPLPPPQIDADHGGTLDIDEVAEMGKMMTKKFPKIVLEPPFDLDRDFAQMDVQGLGEVTYAEFENWWKRCRPNHTRHRGCVEYGGRGADKTDISQYKTEISQYKTDISQSDGTGVSRGRLFCLRSHFATTPDNNHTLPIQNIW